LEFTALKMQKKGIIYFPKLCFSDTEGHLKTQASSWHGGGSNAVS
jgi:hypothetical protein